MPVGYRIRHPGGGRSSVHLHVDSETVAANALEPPPDLVEGLFREHAASVRRLARTIVKDDSLADDVVQEVFLRLHAAPQKFEAERGTAHAYLMACCRGRALDSIRSESARSRRQDRAAADAERSTSYVEEAVLHTELHHQLADAIALLPDHERESLLLAYFGGYTYLEVGELLGLPDGTVKSRIRRGLAHLESILRAGES